MEVRKRTEITVETDEVLVVRRARVYRAWCAECGREVDMVEISDADALSERSKRGTQQDHGSDWHVGASGDLKLVCMESLLKSM